MTTQRFSRRDFLRLGALTAGGLAASPRLGGSPLGLNPTPPPPGSAPAPTTTPVPVVVPFPKETTLPPNPWLRELGFGKKDRVVIVHVDDLGMCEANVEAFAELVDFGLVSSGSVMVPCAWFPLAAHYARTHPQVDLGMHSVLTSEWEAIRWRPLSTSTHGSGLVDSDGYFHRRQEDAVAHANFLDALAELDAQVQQATRAGMDLTHADAHQFVAMLPNFLPAYLRTATKYKLPPLFQRRDEAGWRAFPGMDPGLVSFAVQFTSFLERIGIPVVDNWFMVPMEQPEHRLAITKQILDAVPPGITVLIMHATKDSPELHAITPDWRGRVADYTTWGSDELRRHIRDSGIQTIGWRPIRDLWRKKAG